MYDNIGKNFIEIGEEIANIETPISSGNGDVIMMHASTGTKYFFNNFGILSVK